MGFQEEYYPMIKFIYVLEIEESNASGLDQKSQKLSEFSH